MGRHGGERPKRGVAHSGPQPGGRPFLEGDIPGAGRASKRIEAFLFLGGWGDGPGYLEIGAQIWLTEIRNNHVYYLAGPSPREGEVVLEGGFFPIRDLAAIEHL